MNAIEIRGLSREYTRGGRKVMALRDVDLTIPEGEVHALLGPNGAGKTTLCKILSTVLLPTSGTVTLCGHDVVSRPERAKSLIGIVFGGERGLYGRLTARQNLTYWAALYGLSRGARAERVHALLERLGLGDRGDDRVDTMSRGMKQRLHLARGLVADPSVLILDEPTVGMDPVAARDFRSLITELKADGRTILLTTHDMAEAAELSDRVSMVDKGKLVMTQTPDTVGEIVSRYERVDAREVPPPVVDVLGSLPGVVSVQDRDTGGIRVETADRSATSSVLAALVEAGVTEVSTGRPDLEEVYLHLMGGRGMGVG